MTNLNWKSHPPFNNYSLDSDWLQGVVPDGDDTAIFGKSSRTKLVSTEGITVGGWTFQKGAPHYTFTAEHSLNFKGAGIVVHGGSVQLTALGSILTFSNFSSAGAAHIIAKMNPDLHTLGFVDFVDWSTAGRAVINNEEALSFLDQSSAAHAKITSTSTEFNDNANAGNAHIANKGVVIFKGDSSAANATITTTSDHTIYFFDRSDGDQARFVTRAGGTVDFSDTTGVNNNGSVHAGSIEGAGDYFLGGNSLFVGSNNRSTTVTGAINDGSSVGGGATGGTLFKTGSGQLILAHSGNSFTGGAFIEKGTLTIAMAGAAGTGGIIFDDFSQTLKIANRAMPGHHFTDSIVNFSVRDVIDLPGLNFVRGAKIINLHDDVWMVKSGHAQVVFDDFSPLTFSFKVKSDGHGGTKIVGAQTHAKTAAGHTDSFAFKSEVVHDPRPSPETAAHHSNHAADAGAHEGIVAGILDAVPVHAAFFEFLHQGDFFH